MSDSNNNVPPQAQPPVQPAPGYAAAPAYAPAVPGRTLGIIALIVAFPFNIVGLIMGIIALVQSKRAGASNLPAVFAIIVGALLFVIGVIVLIVLFSTLGAALSACAGLPPGSVVEIGGTPFTCNT